MLPLVLIYFLHETLKLPGRVRMRDDTGPHYRFSYNSSRVEQNFETTENFPVRLIKLPILALP